MSPYVWCWLCLPIICIIFWQFTWIRTKGHLISEGNFCAFKSPKKSTNLMTDLCPCFMGQKSDKDLVGFLGDLKTSKLHSEINWTLVALGRKSMFLLFFSGSTLSQELISFWRILCFATDYASHVMGRGTRLKAAQISWFVKHVGKITLPDCMKWWSKLQQCDREVVTVVGSALCLS